MKQSKSNQCSKMAKFSVDREEEESEEGPSSPKHKKQRRLDGEEERTAGKRSNSTKDDHDLAGPDREGSISVTLIDPEVLDCSICMEPLSPPVFQCENGHIACSSCCSKLTNKCPSCSWPIGYNRCLAIEKVMESIKVSCRNAKYGCKETVSYNQKHNHEETCIYAPCKCPLSDCNFHGSSEQLSRHFSSKHWASARRFRYNCPFPISFDNSESFLVLQAEEDGLLFLLNNQTEIIGNAITVTCMMPSSSKGGFSYDLISRNGGSSLRLESFTKSTKGGMEGSSSMDFLLIPNDFYNCYGQLKLEICIWSSRELE